MFIMQLFKHALPVNLTWTLLVIISLIFLPLAGETLAQSPKSLKRNDRPNMLFIMLDDMGYGDLQCYNPQSKISTPHIDRLAKGGMRFTDAHAPGAVCVPSRYGFLTGRYPSRQGKNHIAPGTLTIASFLQQHSYRTAMIGKWHNGFEQVDGWQGKISGGPYRCGFDYFFGIPHSLDIPPYLYIENDRVVEPPTQTIERGKQVTAGIYETDGWTNIQGAFWRPGKIAPNFKHAQVLPQFTERAIEFLAEQQGATRDEPFFLYLAYAGPHTPWLPSPAYHNKSDAGLYGDFLTEIDQHVGKIISTLDNSGLAENTLVVLTSDNGPVWYPENISQYEHRSAGPLRGMKFDAWEGGHRMPFIARWPGRIPAGSVCNQMICFTDMLRTMAAIIDAPLPPGTGPDSLNVLPLLQGNNEPVRQHLAVSGRKFHSLRLGHFKYLEPRAANQNQDARQQQRSLLFDLQADIAETNNVADHYPEIVKQAKSLLRQLQR